MSERTLHEVRVLGCALVLLPPVPFCTTPRQRRLRGRGAIVGWRGGDTCSGWRDGGRERSDGACQQLCFECVGSLSLRLLRVGGQRGDEVVRGGGYGRRRGGGRGCAGREGGGLLRRGACGRRMATRPVSRLLRHDGEQGWEYRALVWTEVTQCEAAGVQSGDGRTAQVVLARQRQPQRPQRPESG